MSEPEHVTRSVLAGWPLGDPGSSKQSRGTALMVGGSSSVPGAMLLAGEAALRSGAGKLQVATTDGVAAQMAVSIPEALGSRTPELRSGDISPEAADQVHFLAEGAAAVLLGPGITTPDAASRRRPRLWGAWLHDTCGEVLAESVGPLGFPARELPAVVPRLLRELTG